MLEDLFLQSQYPTTEVREKLEQQLGVSENRILVRLFGSYVIQLITRKILIFSIRRFGSKTAELRKREKRNDYKKSGLRENRSILSYSPLPSGPLTSHSTHLSDT